MRLIYTVLLALVIGGCTKNTKNDEQTVTCPEQSSLFWLTAKKAEYSSCTCLTGARQGIYQNQPVIEVYVYDPLCNGINIVYRTDGTVWFNGSEAIYADYISKVKSQKVIWTCSEGDL
jgi:hypothetical protein